MNRRSQGLFEGPFTSEAALYTSLYANPEFYSNPEWKPEWELQEISPYALGEEEWERSPNFSSDRRTIQQT